MDVTLTIIGSILGSIVLSILGNLLTNPVKDWLDKKSFVNRTKRVQSLEKDLKTITELQDFQKLSVVLIAYSLRASFLFMIGICGGLVGIAYLVVRVPTQSAGTITLGSFTELGRKIISPGLASDLSFWVGMICALLGGIFISIALNTYWHAMDIYKYSMNFEEFKKETQKRIQVLTKAQKKRTL